MSRGAGGSWPEPGDRLRGQSAEFLSDLADQVIRDAEACDRADGGGEAIDTTGLAPDESAEVIARAVRLTAS